MYNSDYNRPPEEREPIETEHFHVWDAESPKPPRKKSGAARFVALGLCCALVGGLVGGGGVLAASHLSGGKTTIYQRRRNYRQPTAEPFAPSHQTGGIGGREADGRVGQRQGVQISVLQR